MLILHFPYKFAVNFLALLMPYEKNENPEILIFSEGIYNLFTVCVLFYSN